MKMTRRVFLGTSIATVAVAACGGDDGGGTMIDSTTGTKNCTTNGTAVVIAGNHGHTMVVTMADVTAAADKTYDITGGGGHTHMVTVTAANFASLASNPNGSVMVNSTSAAAHTHAITVTCA